VIVLGLVSAFSARASADSTRLGTNPTPEGATSMASRPAAGGKTRIEAVDGFLTTTLVQITSATFTGLLVGARRPPTSRMSS